LISIEDSQIYWCDEDGFKCTAKTFSPVNLAIKVRESNFQRNDGHGFVVEHVALVECSIDGSNVSKNVLSNVVINSVHNW
jgi:hypothetical protein